MGGGRARTEPELPWSGCRRRPTNREVAERRTSPAHTSTGHPPAFEKMGSTHASPDSHAAEHTLAEQKDQSISGGHRFVPSLGTATVGAGVLGVLRTAHPVLTAKVAAVDPGAESAYSPGDSSQASGVEHASGYWAAGRGGIGVGDRTDEVLAPGDVAPA